MNKTKVKNSKQSTIFHQTKHGTKVKQANNVGSQDEGVFQFITLPLSEFIS